MIRLIIENSYSRIEGLPIKTHKSLSRLLSYRKQIKYKQYDYISLLTKKGVFPTGLLLKVRRYLVTEKIRYEVLDRRGFQNITHVAINGKFDLEPYPEQHESAKVATRSSRGTIVMPTGVGKSIAIALLIDRLRVKTLVVVPNLELKRQLTETLNSIFGKTKNIVVENIDSGNLNRLTGFDCLIIDEAHHAAAATYRKLNRTAWKGIYFRFFFTATPFRSNDDEQLLFESLAGQVIYRLTYRQAVDKGYIVPVEAYYVELPKIDVDNVMWPGVYKELVTGREDRNKAIHNLLFSLALNSVSALVLVKEIAHGRGIADRTGVAFANGEDETSRKHIKDFALDRRKLLIGTTGIIGEGVDTKPCEYVIIAGLGKSKNAIMQQIGRGVRRYEGKESCKVILFKDPSHKWTREHFNAQKKILRDEYGVEPVRLELEGLYE